MLHSSFFNPQSKTAYSKLNTDWRNTHIIPCYWKHEERQPVTIVQHRQARYRCKTFHTISDKDADDCPELTHDSQDLQSSSHKPEIDPSTCGMRKYSIIAWRDFGYYRFPSPTFTKIWVRNDRFFCFPVGKRVIVMTRLNVPFCQIEVLRYNTYFHRLQYTNVTIGSVLVIFWLLY